MVERESRRPSWRWAYKSQESLLTIKAYVGNREIEPFMQVGDKTFDYIFKKATTFDPFPYQRKIALDRNLPNTINVPTGVGKTAAVILAWLWRRRFAEQDIRNTTPRRLVYCLPMRVLVEQTRNSVISWLDNVDMLGGKVDKGDVKDTRKYKQSWDAPDKIVVTVLMGGEDKDRWDRYPERDAIIIGTQDMLLSRVLNRGYGISRYRCPVQFGLLNSDCLWVMDEVQLMGTGLATSVQLDAFRNGGKATEGFGTIGVCQTIWMSATMRHEWLCTVDSDDARLQSGMAQLDDEDKKFGTVQKRISASKTIRPASSNAGSEKALAEEIITTHKPGTRTLAIVNTVARARALYGAIKKAGCQTKLLLIHSHFRPHDRNVLMTKLSSKDFVDSIVISTQVVEAGVDISSRTLFTEIAPWSSMVQRFGRCNRFGEWATADIFWIDVLGIKKNPTLPYEFDEVEASRKILNDVIDASSSRLPKIQDMLPRKHVLRRKDLCELFDTTQDMAGIETDISRFIRDTKENELQVFWREVPEDGPNENVPLADRDELCSTGISDIKFLQKKDLRAWYYDYLESRWIPVSKATQIYPGMILMLDARRGMYTSEEGWDIHSKEDVEALDPVSTPARDSYTSDWLSSSDWMTIATHTDHVVNITNSIVKSLSLGNDITQPLLGAARWHDCGKAHASWQANIERINAPVAFKDALLAKAPNSAWKKGRLPEVMADDGRRKHMRHEFVSGIIALQNNLGDLTAYLCAAHHGKVRMSLRSMPDEYRPPQEGIRFARGAWDGDTVPQDPRLDIDLGGGVRCARIKLNLSPMELGEGQLGASWTARMVALRDSKELGPFRLAMMEAILRAADERASGGMN
ncbi:MAG: CRISPR-associated helicase Cas3' [Thermoplasmata archaeon]|nr:CRISPR-associated helicase Cas3' [Candidatus Sysuiplasma jiujiangense]